MLAGYWTTAIARDVYSLSYCTKSKIYHFLSVLYNEGRLKLNLFLFGSLR